MAPNLRTVLTQTIHRLYPEYHGLVTLDVKKERDDFEYSTPVVFALAKHLGKPPQEIVEKVKSHLEQELGEAVTVFTVDGAPPFINFRFNSSAWLSTLNQLKEDTIFVNHKPWDKKRVLVEFISANPTGPLTLANGRGGYSGDALANVMTFAGADVMREYYVNDVGNQIVQLGKSILAKQTNTEIEDGYKGEYIDELSQHIHGKTAAELGDKAADYILRHWIQPAVEKMGIRFDTFFSEKALVENNIVHYTYELLERHKLTYSLDGALWLRTTDFGDDKDRVLKRSDGTYTYFMGDIAYHWDKVQRGYDVIVTMVGADHFTESRALDMVLKHVLSPVARWEGEFVQPIIQFVRLIENGQEVKMSKRAGNFVTLDDLLERVPSDVARFFFIWHALNTRMDFDLDLAQKQSDENPVYYVQYAYVRAKHILEKLDKSISLPVELDVSPEERRLMLHMLELPQTINDILQTHEVHKLAHYAVELAKLFHSFYAKHSVLKAESAVMDQRVAITRSTLNTITLVLSLMGVSQPERMVSEDKPNL